MFLLYEGAVSDGPSRELARSGRCRGCTHGERFRFPVALNKNRIIIIDTGAGFDPGIDLARSFRFLFRFGEAAELSATEW